MISQGVVLAEYRGGHQCVFNRMRNADRSQFEAMECAKNQRRSVLKHGVRPLVKIRLAHACGQVAVLRSRVEGFVDRERLLLELRAVREGTDNEPFHRPTHLVPGIGSKRMETIVSGVGKDQKTHRGVGRLVAGNDMLRSAQSCGYRKPR